MALRGQQLVDILDQFDLVQTAVAAGQKATARDLLKAIAATVKDEAIADLWEDIAGVLRRPGAAAKAPDRGRVAMALVTRATKLGEDAMATRLQAQVDKEDADLIAAGLPSIKDPPPGG